MATLKEKTAKGLFWSALNNATMQLLNVVFGIILARLLIPADYGLIGMLTIFTTVAGALQEGGFTIALANLKKPTDNDYNAVFWFSTSLGLTFYAILFLCAPLIAGFFHQPQLVKLSRFVFLTIIFSAVSTAPYAYLYKNIKIKETTIIRITSLLISGIAGIILAVQGKTYWSLAWQQVIYIGLSGLSRFLIVAWKPSFKVDFSPIRKMFGFSSKILITNIVNNISNNILTVIFGRLFPVKTVGNFTQAYKWNNMASSFITGTVGQVAQPVFVATNGEADRQLAVLRKMIRFTAFLAFPCMLGLAIISKEFLVILISDKWIDSVPILQILCVSGAFLPLYNPLQNIIISHGRSDTFMWLSIGQIIIQIALILVFAPYGILPMVAVYSMFCGVWTAVWYWRASRIVSYRFMHFIKDTMPFLLAAIAACGIAFAAGSMLDNMIAALAAKVAVAVVIYYTIMRIAHAKIMDECLDYLLKRKRNI